MEDGCDHGEPYADRTGRTGQRDEDKSGSGERPRLLGYIPDEFHVTGYLRRLTDAGASGDNGDAVAAVTTTIVRR